MFLYVSRLDDRLQFEVCHVRSTAFTSVFTARKGNPRAFVPPVVFLLTFALAYVYYRCDDKYKPASYGGCGILVYALTV